MKDISKLYVNTQTTIKEALAIIDKAAMRIAIVIDNDKKFLGTLNDGDIRRAILAGNNLDSHIENIYFKNSKTALNSDTKESIIKKAIQHKIYQIPILDENNCVVDVLDLATLLTTQKEKTK